MALPCIDPIDPRSLYTWSHCAWLVSGCTALLIFVAQAITFTVLPSVICYDPVLLGFLGVYAGCSLFSLQIHAWAHCTKDKLPLLLMAPLKHPAQNCSPYDTNYYCMVTRRWNMKQDFGQVQIFYCTGGDYFLYAWSASEILE
ncbi:fatty acid desaturase 4 [Forsythia ovata]|uniref:Fatty acid desaturase 4 n=1 Tax=Forsythia ovata TaxID=205694 RepID=A0ABD1QD63_9LAMI